VNEAMEACEEQYTWTTEEYVMNISKPAAAEAEIDASGATRRRGLFELVKQKLGVGSSVSTRQEADAVLEVVDMKYCECLTGKLVHRVEELERVLTRYRKGKGKLSEPLRNQTCHDPVVQTMGPDVEAHRWVAMDDHPDGVQGGPGLGSDGSNRTYQVHQLLRRNGAQIHVIDDFVSDDECRFLMEDGRPRLTRSTVSQEGNNQAVSAYRNSQAANVIPKFNQPNDPAARMMRRAYQFANDHTGFNLSLAGQEPFSLIQYNPGQEYRPHCDGSCDGSRHLHAGRVSTMLFICHTASGGGGTSFTNAGAHVVPRRNQAIFFSYRDHTGRMEVSLTEHSGCPVDDGEKWVATLWMRDGVSDADPWTNFDPVGGRL